MCISSFVIIHRSTVLSVLISNLINRYNSLTLAPNMPCMLLVVIVMLQTLESSLAGQTLATPTGGRVWSNSHHDLVSNTPRISWRVNWVSDEWGAQLPFLACSFERRRPAFAERVPIYVHTYFIRRLAAECAIQKPDGNLTRLSPSRESLACETILKALPYHQDVSLFAPSWMSQGSSPSFPHCRSRSNSNCSATTIVASVDHTWNVFHFKFK